MFKPLNNEKWDICVSTVHMKNSFNMTLSGNLLLFFHRECQEPVPTCIFYFSYSFLTPSCSWDKGHKKCIFLLRERISSVPNYTNHAYLLLTEHILLLSNTIFNEEVFIRPNTRLHYYLPTILKGLILF